MFVGKSIIEEMKVRELKYRDEKKIESMERTIIEKEG